MDHVVSALVDLADSTARSLHDAEDVRAVKRHIIDTVGCAVAGYSNPSAEIVRRLMRRPSGGVSSIFGEELKVSMEQAAFANGVMTRCLDLNDSYFASNGGGHPSDYIAAVLAVAEARDVSGLELLRAVAISYEVFCRLTDATSLARSYVDHVVHGSVSTALAVGYLMGLDGARTRNAVCLALAPNLPLAETRFGEVSMWKNCASAYAGRNAILAANLASAGLTGPPEVFVGRSGFIAATDGHFEADALRPTARPTALTRCNLKRYPGGFLSQSAVDAALDVRGRIPPSGHIVRVEVGTSAFARQVMAGDEQKWHPITRETADHSIPFLVASALVHGVVDATTYTVSGLTSSETRRIMSCLYVEEDSACNAMWPDHAGSRVTVSLNEGSTMVALAVDYRGHFRNPLSDDEVSEKFMRNVEGGLSNAHAIRMLEALWDLDKIDAVSDVTRLFPIVQAN